MARKKDKGLGKIDLLGVTDEGRLMVIELKVKPKGDNKRGESPAAALMQGLRYAAIIEANQREIAAEALRCFKVEIKGESPVVQILAPKAWWRAWSELGASPPRATGNWEPEFSKLARDIENKLGIAIECVALDDHDHTDFGSDRRKPRLDRAPALYPVRLETYTCRIGTALPAHRPGK